MGKIEIDHTGSGSGITLSSDGTSLLLGGTAVGGGGGSPDLFADNDVSATAPSATGDNSVAIGPSSEANSADATAFGYRSEAKASKAVAIGEGRAGGASATAISIGTTSTAYGATGTRSVAMGYQAKATGLYSFALGANSVSTGQDSFAVGKSLASTSQGFAVQINNNTTSYGASGVFGSTAIGNTAKATGSVAIALGQGSIASGSKALAFGTTATASSTNSVAIGYNSVANVADGVAIGGSGKQVKISGTYTLPTADGTNGQVMTTDGSGAVTFADAGGGGADLYAANESSPSAQPSATGTNSIAIGDSAISTGTNSFAGPNSRAQNSNTVALGINSNSSSYGALGNYSVAIGYAAKAANSWAISIGRSAISTQNESFAIGKSLAGGDTSFAAQITNNTTSYGATGTKSIAIGYQAKATASYSEAIGFQAQATNTHSIAIGRGTNSSGASGSVAIGYYADADGESSLALGHRSKSRMIGELAFASHSISGDTGNSQTAIRVLVSNTTDATAEAMTTNNSTASTDNQIVLPNNSCYGFTGTVIAREDSSATNDFAIWEIKGGAVRAASASTTALGTYNINKISESTGATNWSIALSADTTNGAVAITVTGEASHNIRWVATVNTTEVTY